ncbi:MAG: nucleotide exchange factor GrpE [Jatrophihabitantaceae bacterium]
MSDRPRPGPHPDEPDRVVIRDKRKIDPVTGKARPGVEPGPDHAASSTPEASNPAPSADAELLAERTADLQRLQAEYANYRKRTDRERLAAGELAVGRALSELLPVLDDIERARTHGDLTGGLKAIADHLEVVTAKLGLQAFGEDGDPFDPTIHEAVMHNESEDVTEPTCTTVMRRGYRHGDRLLRAAMVGVSDPLPPPGLGASGLGPSAGGDDAAPSEEVAASEDGATPDDDPAETAE